MRLAREVLRVISGEDCGARPVYDCLSGCVADECE